MTLLSPLELMTVIVINVSDKIRFCVLGRAQAEYVL